jgi:hypothetical protein
VSAINNKTTTESAAQIETTCSYMDLSFIRAPKKNHDAIEQIGKPFVQWFKKHGVRPEIYHLSSSSSTTTTTSEQEAAAAAPEGLESIAKTLSIGDVAAAASSVDIIELKPRSDDVAINRYDVMLVRLTLTLTGFTESTVIENYLIFSP